MEETTPQSIVGRLAAEKNNRLGNILKQLQVSVALKALSFLFPSNATHLGRF